MRILCVFLLLLALWAVSTHSKQRLEEQHKRDTRDAVLIRSKRRWVLSTIELEEEDPGPFPRKATQLFNDKDSIHTLRFSISGQGVTEDPVGVFSIDDRTGDVYVHKPIDRELYPFFLVKFDVKDRVTNEILDRTLAFNVAIKDKNDNPPIFNVDVLNAHIPENINEGLLPLSLQANDKDEKNTNNSLITMRVVSQEPQQPQIMLQTVQNTMKDDVRQLVFTGCFDYDKANKYKLLVEARDHGTPSLSSTATVFIDITDSNTHAPVFKSSVYNGEVMEMQSNKEILRVAIEDKDTPNTPASRAVYSIVKGNEQGYYKIETDPATNEGVLTVIKGKDYEKTTLTELELAVENEEPLFMCVDGKPVTPVLDSTKKNSSAKIQVKVIDVNDPPVFKNKIQRLYRKEEDKPGEVLYEPIVTDEDSDIIRYEIVDDPAKWMSINSKTGIITTAKVMDRESPFVKNSTYTIVIHAIDNGEPPATGTGTLEIHLGDINDNTPRLVTNSSVMCANKVNHVSVEPSDMDDDPFRGPFTFSLGDNEALKKIWKFNPNTGSKTSLVSQQSLAYGNYSVPLHIEDQQGVAGHNVLQVEVCDCGEVDVCRTLHPRSSHLHPIAVLIMLAALVLLALLLCLCLVCNRKKDFQDFQVFKNKEEGNQSLITYNDECRGTDMKAEPSVIQANNSGFGMKPVQIPGSSSAWVNGSSIKQEGFYKHTINRGNTTRSGTIKSFGRSFSQPEWNIEGYLDQVLLGIVEDKVDIPACHPHLYSDEGIGSKNHSLDSLSFSTGDNLDFLQDLGPRFYTLAGICSQGMQDKNMKQ